jgi:hypothetical protein
MKFFKKLVFFSVLMSILLMSGLAVADKSKTTRAIHITGSMIREAMLVQANEKQPDLYFKALDMFKEAKEAYRGQGRFYKNRSFEKVMLLSREAYRLAMRARNLSKPEFYKDSKNNFDRSLEIPQKEEELRHQY